MPSIVRQTLPALIAAALAATTTLPAAAQTKVNIAYVLGVDFLPVFVSKENACFAGKGLDVTLTFIPIANNIPATIVSGSAQIGMTTAPILLQAAENGLDLVAVAGASRMSKSNPTMSVVMRTEVKAATAADLKGRKIGVPGINSLGDIVFRKWLKDNGLKAGEVTTVEAPIPQMADLIKGGTVDGVVIMEPIRSRITSSGGGYRHPIEYYPATAPDSVLTMWISSGAWAKANAPAVAAFRACVASGIDSIKADPENAKKVEIQYLKIASPTYPVHEAVIKPDDLKIHADISTEMGLLKKPANLSALVLP